MGLPASVLETTPSILPMPRPRLAVDAPALSVVIVNFRQWANTAQLTQQLRQAQSVQQDRAEVVIVDNHSPAHAWMRRMRRWSGVSLRRFGRNRGFARAVNEGCRLGRGEWVLLLNPDMRVEPGFLDRVMELMQSLEQSSPQVGIVGFRLRHDDGSLQASAGQFPTLRSTLLGLCRSRKTRKCQPVDGNQRREVAWLTGCCLLIRRTCLEQLGGFDESYFLYYEDVDFCQRARQLGWSVVYDPSLEAVHFSPLHLRAVPPPLRLMTRHALLTYSEKHWSKWQTHLLGRIIRLEAWYRGILARTKQQPDAAEAYQRLGMLARELMQGQPQEARRHIRWAARQLETAALADDR
ncbi:glycosyltransferase family 2 protein [Tuwongella immobilis]|uniref:Glycosyltransferase 2-like domain-containing protein n=1 Tax=Tuwongella immobilis TaxID=692036 RepID=A0A6C2YK89_9BACT|nr:glycosyltransferase family 2 protein [Tuwongella immobilis]VIP01523.1 Putative glycosyltransferase OS=Singulisphaera acidiphila (strain ATCC BAA-1392 / DSM 18658 / VKM B-2454 / MOB10) GN=Sinac_5389 PE=4 SV=1: Glyco_tranf_2_3 [Tuwongella immobilis]VTR98661.1 Putative glycosyltransferase OS=Singulisphaera acidiphila (strain ATCC BAA-1392 / DSM 18658 / VKM B-2454 / MOB10) GN=Sinac_5389 PE=4 SV=1: Glyco_tranf_2_3 [Tuwongella immobilis]